MAKMNDASARELELRSQMRALSEELETLTEKREKNETKELLGKCFRFRNSYGGSQPDEGWWLYARVVQVGNEVKVCKFETDNSGDMRIQIDGLFSAGQFHGYQPITFMEFAEAFRYLNVDVRNFGELATAE